jgi:hypothetical protein
MTIREEVTKFGKHVDFQIHKIKIVSPFAIAARVNSQGF